MLLMAKIFAADLLYHIAGDPVGIIIDLQVILWYILV
jgi:hypothetical protein